MYRTLIYIKRLSADAWGGIRYSKAKNVIVLFMKSRGQYENCKYVGRMVLVEARIEKRETVCGDYEDKAIFLLKRAE